MITRPFYKTFLTSLLLVLSTSVNAQSISIDSLKKIWNNDHLEDIIQFKAVMEIAGHGFLYTQSDSAFFYAQKGYEFAKERKLQRQVGTALNMLGVVSETRGDYLSSIDYHSQSLRINKKLGYRKGIAASLNNIGILFEIQENYDQALEYYQRFLEIMTKEDDKRGVAIAYNNIGNIYLLMEDYTESLDYHERSLKISEGISDQAGVSTSLNNIGHVYRLENQDTKALEYFFNALAASEKSGDKRGMCASYNSLGSMYIRLNDYTKALEYASKALTIAKELGNVEKTRDAAENLYLIFKSQGKSAVSLEMYELFIEMRDSMLDVDAQKQVIRQEFEYNYETQKLADSISLAKQKEIDVLSERDATNKRYVVYLGLLIILVFVGIYLKMRSAKGKAEKRELLQDVKILKTEAIIKVASSVTEIKHLPLDKDKIEASIEGSLNQSDWNILNALYENPTISNRAIAEKVSLSMSGVHSSLRKMYRIFDLDSKTENQRITLVVEAVKRSSLSK